MGFFTKEVRAVLRQPLLVGSLIFGPFAILLTFGLGYSGPQPEFRTILVVPDDPAIAAQIDLYREGFAGVFNLQEVTPDEAYAMAQLRADRADVVVIAPQNVYGQLYNGKSAELRVVYTETDPTSNGWVQYFTQVQTSELNRRILVELLSQSRGPASRALEFADQAQAELDGLEAELRNGNYAGAADRVDRLLADSETAPTEHLQTLDALVRAGEEPVQAEPAGATTLMPSVRQLLRGLRDELAAGAAGQAVALERIEEIRAKLEQLEAIAQRINSIPPETLVSPLMAQAQNVARVQPSALGFYTPAVLALLLQHIGVTLSSLSAVRDRLLGSMELFRVSPVGAGQILLGKSLGIGLILTLVGAALTCAT